MRITSIWLVFFVTFALTASVSLVVAQQAQESDVIFVGSKADPESQILGWIIFTTLEDAGYRVVGRHIPFGRTAETRAALLGGTIDVYVEYTGTGISILHQQFPEQIDLRVAFNPELAISTLNSYDGPNFDLEWLTPAPANTTYGLAVTEDFSSENNIYTVEDLAVYINAGNSVIVAGETEFFSRTDGLQSFERGYNFDLQDNQLYNIPDAQPSQTLAALEESINGTNVAMVYRTSAELLVGEFVFLEDTLPAQPYYRPAPVFRGEVIRAHPEIVSLIQPVFEGLDDLTLRELNARATIFGDEYPKVAADYLTEIGILTGIDVVTVCSVTRPFEADESANLRSEPRVDSVRVGQMSAGSTLTANGKYEASDGIWYRLTIGAWVRADTVVEDGACEQLAFVTP
jgi:osmoprotectant transport system substrate-binding protein